MGLFERHFGTVIEEPKKKGLFERHFEAAPEVEPVTEMIDRLQKKTEDMKSEPKKPGLFERAFGVVKEKVTPGARMPFVPGEKKPTTVGKPIDYAGKVFEPKFALTTEHIQKADAILQKTKGEKLIQIGTFDEIKLPSIEQAMKDAKEYGIEEQARNQIIDSMFTPEVQEETAFDLSIKEQREHPLRAIFKAGERVPAGIIGAAKASIDKESLAIGFMRGFAPEIPLVGEKKKAEPFKTATQIAWDKADEIYGKNPSTSIGWNYLRYLPFTAVAKPTEIFANPINWLIFKAIGGVLRDPTVSKIMGKKILAPKWFDDMIGGTARFFQDPLNLKGAAKRIQESRINAIVNEAYGKLEPSKINELKTNYKKTMGIEPVEADLKGWIKKGLIEKGIYNQPLQQLQELFVKVGNLPPIGQRGAVPALSRTDIIEAITRISPNISPETLAGMSIPALAEVAKSLKIDISKLKAPTTPEIVPPEGIEGAKAGEGVGEVAPAPVTPELQPLVEEAKKYKTAEKFVESYNVFHGTPAEIEGGKLKFGAGKQLKKGGYMGGLFLTDKEEAAQAFQFGGKIYRAKGDIKNKVFDVNKNKKLFKDFIGKKFKNQDGEMETFTKQYYDFMFPDGGDADWATVYADLAEQFAREQGKIGIAIKEYAGGVEATTYQIFEGEIPIYTEQQLTAIWQQAQAKPTPEVAPPVAKPKPPAKIPVTEKEVQFRVKKLETETTTLHGQLRQLEEQRDRFQKLGKATGALDKQIKKLEDKYFYAESEIAEIMTGAPKELRPVTKIEMKVGDLMREERIISKEAFQRGQKEGTISQKLHYEQMQTRMKARKEERTKVNKMIADIKKIDTSEMTPENASAINDLLKDIDLVKRNKKTKMKWIQKATAYLRYNEESVELPDYMQEKLEQLSLRDMNDITVDELEAIHNTVLHYAHLDKEAQMIRVGAQKLKSKLVLKHSVQEMKPSGKIKEGIVSSQKSKLGKLKNAGQLIKDTFGVRHDHYDLIIESLAGVNSTMDKILYQQVKEGIKKELKYKQDAFKQFQKDLDLEGFQEKHSIKNIANWQNERVTIAGFDLNRGERMALYKHSLNENNRRHLLEGGFALKEDKTFTNNKITEDQLNQIIDSLTLAEKEFAGKPIDNLFENQYNELNKIFMAKNGYALPKENNYYPIEVSKIALPKELEAQDALEQFKHKWVKIGLKKGMLQHRQRSKLPIYLNSISYDVNNSVMNSAAYIGLEMPLSDASKLLYNPQFKSEMFKRYSPTVWKEIDKGLRDIAGDWKSYTTTEELALKLKNKLSTAILGFNPFVMAKQILSFPLYNIYVKPQYCIQGFIDFAFNPNEIMTRNKLYSPEYTERVEGGYSRDVADVFKTGAEKRMYKGQKSIQEKLMGGIKLFDSGAVTPGMHGAVLQVLDEIKIGKFSSEVKTALNMDATEVAKLSPEEQMKLAYKFADWVTQRTQPMFSLEHRSSLSRGATIEKLATQFTSFTNQALNLIRRNWRTAQETGDPKAYAKLLKALFYLLIVNTGGVFAIDTIRDKIYKRKTKKTFGEAILDSVASYFYFIRDVERSVVSKIKRGTFLGYDISIPVLGFGNKVASTVADGFGSVLETKKKKREKRTRKFVDGAIEIMLTLNGIPYRTPKNLLTKPFQKEEKKKTKRLKRPKTL